MLSWLLVSSSVVDTGACCCRCCNSDSFVCNCSNSSTIISRFFNSSSTCCLTSTGSESERKKGKISECREHESKEENGGRVRREEKREEGEIGRGERTYFFLLLLLLHSQTILYEHVWQDLCKKIICRGTEKEARARQREMGREGSIWEESREEEPKYNICYIYIPPVEEVNHWPAVFLGVGGVEADAEEERLRRIVGSGGEVERLREGTEGEEEAKEQK